jgi:Flp pilus assembly pilin Flp
MRTRNTEVMRIFALVAIAVLVAANTVDGAEQTRRGGGNCGNKCDSAMDPHYKRCIAATPCVNAKTACDADKANCKCGSDCQECFADIYSACGGCEQNNFDTSMGPGIKKTAEGMGCSGAASVPCGILPVLLASVLVMFNICY